ncbi:P1 family peptidase, partial [Phenylobacterium sp.]|uniref:P1 family peptidase n=1 Tax=Phenylobacterium sp. TaxID=1871053 RepID=UPI0039C9F6FA
MRRLLSMPIMSSLQAAGPGRRNLITDVPGLRVGQAHDEGARTGVTVILPDERAVAACD